MLTWTDQPPMPKAPEPTWTDDTTNRANVWGRVAPYLVGSIVTLLVFGVGVLAGSHLVNLETRAQLRYVEQRYEWSQEKAQKAIFENRELKAKLAAQIRDGK